MPPISKWNTYFIHLCNLIEDPPIVGRLLLGQAIILLLGGEHIDGRGLRHLGAEHLLEGGESSQCHFYRFTIQLSRNFEVQSFSVLGEGHPYWLNFIFTTIISFTGSGYSVDLLLYYRYCRTSLMILADNFVTNCRKKWTKTISNRMTLGSDAQLWKRLFYTLLEHLG